MVDIFDAQKWSAESTINDVLHVPEMGELNLLSTGAITKRGFEVTHSGDEVAIRKGGKNVLIGKFGDNNLYMMLRICGLSAHHSWRAA